MGIKKQAVFIDRCWTQFSIYDILGARQWDQYIKLSDESKSQFDIWKKNVTKLNTILGLFQMVLIVFCDASCTLFAGYAVSTTKTCISHNTKEESAKSSKSLVHNLGGQGVK